MIIKKMKSTNKADREMTKRFKLAVKQEIEKKKALGVPIAKYDVKSGKEKVYDAREVFKELGVQ